MNENNKQFVDSIQNFNNAKYKYCIALSIIHVYKIFLFTNGSRDNYSTNKCLLQQKKRRKSEMVIYKFLTKINKVKRYLKSIIKTFYHDKYVLRKQITCTLSL
jgi:hypothetical protein